MELVTRYKPWFVFTDGEWVASDKTFKSLDLVSWLLNDSPVKDYVVFNDRWGDDSSGKNGMVFNTEFGGGSGFKDHAWQEDRSFGPSYGYNRNLKITDYDTPDELIKMICQCVSKGGNIILGVGPKADGTIPEIYRERLLQMGDWLKVNGEAIYGSTKWQKTEQIKKVIVSKIDSIVNLEWKLAVPDSRIPKNKFNSVWESLLKPDKTDDYQLILTTFGQSKIYVNDSLLISMKGDNENGHIKPDSVSVHLDKNKSYKLKVEYLFEQNDFTIKTSKVSLQWSRPGLTKELIPPSMFFVNKNCVTHGLNVTYAAEMPAILYTKKAHMLYAICTTWPDEDLVLDGVVPSKAATISILGIGENLKWSVKNNNLHIKVPQLTIDKLSCQYAWTFKIENFD